MEKPVIPPIGTPGTETLAMALFTSTRLDGETTQEFVHQLQKLTWEDRLWFRDQFQAEGLVITN